MLLKGRGPNGPFTHRIHKARYARLMKWLTVGGLPAGQCLVHDRGPCICGFFGGVPCDCKPCLLMKLFGDDCAAGSKSVENARAMAACGRGAKDDLRILRNARRRLRAMAKRGEEASDA